MLPEPCELELLLRACERRLAQAPQDCSLWTNRGVLLEQLGRPEEALTSYNRALQVNPERSEAWNNRASLLEQLGLLEDALESVQQAIALDSGPASYWNTRAIIERRLGLAAAVTSARQGLEREPELQPLRWTYARALLESGQPAEARTQLDWLAQRLPDNPSLWLQLAELYLRLECPEPALEQADHALALDPSLAEGWRLRGHALFNQGDYGAALGAYEIAQSLGGLSGDLLEHRAHALAHCRRTEDALEAYEQAIALHPRPGQLCCYQGLLLTLTERFPEAEAAFDRALRFDAHLADAWYNRAALRSRLGESEAALADLREALRLDRGHYARLALVDDDFRGLRPLPSFQSLLS